jgi:hypothetical protein
MREMLNGLLSGLFPLVRHKTDKASNADVAAGVVMMRCWSKGLGEPILIRFGRRELISENEGDGESLTAVRAYLNIARHIGKQTAGELAGTVDVLADASFRDFEDGDL